MEGLEADALIYLELCWSRRLENERYLTRCEILELESGVLNSQTYDHFLLFPSFLLFLKL